MIPIQKEQDCQVIDKKEENIHSSSFENEPTQINKESEHIPTQMKYKKSYMRPTLNKSVNFDSYQTEVLHPIPQYRKKIIRQCSFANTPNDDSGSKTNRLLQSQYTKHSKICSTTERIQTPLALTDLKTNNKRNTEDINSFPIKEEDENNHNKISIKLLLSTLNEKGLVDIKEEVNRLLTISKK